MHFDVGSWSVPEVCDWVEYIGLGQYRKRFVHHCVDGRLLLRLTETQLKVSRRRCFTAPRCEACLAAVDCGVL